MDYPSLVMLAALTVTTPDVPLSFGNGLFCDTAEQVEDIKRLHIEHRLPMALIVDEYNKAVGETACNFYDEPVLNLAVIRKSGFFTVGPATFDVFEVRVYGVLFEEASGVKSYRKRDPSVIQYQFFLKSVAPP